MKGLMLFLLIFTVVSLEYPSDYMDNCEEMVVKKFETLEEVNQYIAGKYSGNVFVFEGSPIELEDREIPVISKTRILTVKEIK